MSAMQSWRERMSERQAELEGKRGPVEWRDPEGRTYRQWCVHVRHVLRVNQEIKQLREQGDRSHP